LNDLDREMDRLITLVRDLLELTTLEGGEAIVNRLLSKSWFAICLNRWPPVLSVRISDY